MKLILSRYGGEISPKDRLYSNAIHGYSEKYSDLLKQNAVPICGFLDIDFKPENLSFISYERGEHNRYERGFELISEGKNLSSNSEIYEKRLKNIKHFIDKNFNLELSVKNLLDGWKVNVDVYKFPKCVDWMKDSLVCVDKTETFDSIIEHSDLFGSSEIFRNDPVGEIYDVPISLFSQSSRFVFNSLRKKLTTNSSIILPSYSKYNHFWTDRFDVEQK